MGGWKRATPPPSVLIASWKRNRVSRAGGWGPFPSPLRDLRPLFPAAPGGRGRPSSDTCAAGSPGPAGLGRDGVGGGARGSGGGHGTNGGWETCQVPLVISSQENSAWPEREVAFFFFFSAVKVISCVLCALSA